MESDFIELRGGDGLDTDLMSLAGKLCLEKEQLSKFDLNFNLINFKF